jgi:hypothetical protein
VGAHPDLLRASAARLVGADASSSSDGVEALVSLAGKTGVVTALTEVTGDPVVAFAGGRTAAFSELALMPVSGKRIDRC